MRVRIFLFHRVSDEKDEHWPPMRPAVFRRILKEIASRYTVVPLEQYLDDDTGFGKLRRPPAALVFDDGYKDNITSAAPILDDFRFPASFYVVTDCITNDMPPWTYVLGHALQDTKNAALTLDLDFVPEDLRHVDIRSTASFRLKPFMKTLQHQQRQKLMESILSQTEDAMVKAGKMMNWSDLGQLRSAGHYIGSHSRSHPLLASLENEQEIFEELELSAKDIQRHLGHFPKTISYPNGNFDERVKEAAKKAGYSYGLALKYRYYDPNLDDPFEIARIELYEEPMWKTLMRMNGIFYRVSKLIR